jgi:hypoxanthine phosphoribosyltransferase
VNDYYSSKVLCSWLDVEDMVKVLAAKIQKSNKSYDIVLGITNGGIVPAALIARELGIDHLQFIPIRNKILHKYEMPRLYKEKKYLVIDEIYDTGSLMHSRCWIVILHSLLADTLKALLFLSVKY